MTSYFFGDDRGEGFTKGEDDLMGDGSLKKPLKDLIGEALNDKDGKSSSYTNGGKMYTIRKFVDKDGRPVFVQCSEEDDCAFRRTLIKQPTDPIGPITELLVSKYPKNRNYASVQYNRNLSIENEIGTEDSFVIALDQHGMLSISLIRRRFKFAKDRGGLYLSKVQGSDILLADYQERNAISLTKPTLTEAANIDEKIKQFMIKNSIKIGDGEKDFHEDSTIGQKLSAGSLKGGRLIRSKKTKQSRRNRKSRQNRKSKRFY